MTLQKPHLALPMIREAEAARNTSDVDVDHQLLGESAGGNSLSDVPLTDDPLSYVSFSDALLPEACPDGSVGEG